MERIAHGGHEAGFAFLTEAEDKHNGFFGDFQAAQKLFTGGIRRAGWQFHRREEGIAYLLGAIEHFLNSGGEISGGGLFHFVFEHFFLVEKRFDSAGKVIGLALELVGEAGDEFGLLAHDLASQFASNALDAAHSLCDRLLAGDVEVARLACAGEVGAATEFDGVGCGGLGDSILADQNHADGIGIFFAKDSADTGNFLGLFQWHGGHCDRQVGANSVVDQVFDAGNLSGCEGFVVGEIEAGFLVIDQ